MAELPPRSYLVHPDGSLKPPTRYRVIDEYPWQERQDEYCDLSLEEAAVRVEDLYPVEAAQIIADVEEGTDWPLVFDDIETSRRVLLAKEVEA